MLRTNTKKAAANIRAYIMDGFTPEGYTDNPPQEFPEVAAFILDTCYYYNRSAVDDLGAILEETEEEKARFTEQEAEQLLTDLIYRELTKGAARK